MEKSARKARIKEIEKELSYKESQFWEDSPFHDMKIGALREELADLKKEDEADAIFTLKNLEKLLNWLNIDKK